MVMGTSPIALARQPRLLMRLSGLNSKRLASTAALEGE